jgi:dolichol-phosphate mannosyltransferase
VPEKVVVIPTYNERGNIERLLPELLQVDPAVEVVIVDDQSPDGTADAVEELGRKLGRIHVVRRGPKQGIGPAYRAGFKHALALGAEYIVQMDADFSHPIASLPDLFANAEREYDVVLGSRYMDGITVVRWPIERLLISYFGNYYVRKLTGLPVRDTTGGFKCWRRKALLAIDLDQVRSNGYSFQIEMTFRAAQRGMKVVEVPIVFVDRRAGQSKMSRKIFAEAIGVVWKLRFDAMRGKL